jgi:hypothetical protein
MWFSGHCQRPLRRADADSANRRNRSRRHALADAHEGFATVDEMERERRKAVTMADFAPLFDALRAPPPGYVVEAGFTQLNANLASWRFRRPEPARGR